MRFSLVVLPAILLWSVAAKAQLPSYNLGRAPSEEELYPADGAVGPDGQGLPSGSGTAEQGGTVYLARNCGTCHGPTGMEGPGPSLVGKN